MNKKYYELLWVVVMENKRREQVELEENREKIPKLRREFVKEKPEFERRIKLEQMKLEESIRKRGKEYIYVIL